MEDGETIPERSEIIYHSSLITYHYQGTIPKRAEMILEDAETIPNCGDVFNISSRTILKEAKAIHEIALTIERATEAENCAPLIKLCLVNLHNSTYYTEQTIMKKHLFSLVLVFLFSAISFAQPAPKAKAKPTPLSKIDFLMGSFEPANHKDFVLVDVKYYSCTYTEEGCGGRKHYLQEEAYAKYIKMFDAAKDEQCLHLTIASSTRNFKAQKKIWETEWAVNSNLSDFADRAKKILTYSSMPGSSRHHWGTDIDLIVASSEIWKTDKYKREYEWLADNANRFGFCQPYNAGRTVGYKEEKWHWSYKPLSKGFTSDAKANLKDTLLVGFFGAETAVSLDIVKNYVLGINSACTE